MNKNSKTYRALRWAYQPVKLLRRELQEASYGASRRKALANLSGMSFAGLNIGCGPHVYEGWFNTDLIPNADMDFPLDIRKPLPLMDACLDAIYGQEVIEHVELAEARNFFREAVRILKPSGVLRLTTPSLDDVCRVYLKLHPTTRPADFGTVWLDGEFSDEIWVNAQFRAWGHRFVYSFEALQRELQAAGFREVVRVNAQQTNSGRSQLENLEVRYGADAPRWIFDYTMVVEAFKTADAHSRHNGA